MFYYIIIIYEQIFLMINIFQEVSRGHSNDTDLNVLIGQIFPRACVVENDEHGPDSNARKQFEKMPFIAVILPLKRHLIIQRVRMNGKHLKSIKANIITYLYDFSR